MISFVSVFGRGDAWTRTSPGRKSSGPVIGRKMPAGTANGTVRKSDPVLPFVLPIGYKPT